MAAWAATSTQGSCPCSLGRGVSSLTDDFILVIESSAGHSLSPWVAGGWYFTNILNVNAASLNIWGYALALEMWQPLCYFLREKMSFSCIVIDCEEKK